MKKKKLLSLTMRRALKIIWPITKRDNIFSEFFSRGQFRLEDVALIEKEYEVRALQ